MGNDQKSAIPCASVRNEVFRRIEGVTLFNKGCSSEIRKSLNIELLLLGIERSQLRWFGHVSRMPQKRLSKQALLAKANGRRPVGRPKTRWTNYIEGLGWNRLGLHPSEMMNVMEDREEWRLNLELLPRNSHGKAGNEKRTKEEKKYRKEIFIIDHTVLVEIVVHLFMRWRRRKTACCLNKKRMIKSKSRLSIFVSLSSKNLIFLPNLNLKKLNLPNLNSDLLK